MSDCFVDHFSLMSFHMRNADLLLTRLERGKAVQRQLSRKDLIESIEELVCASKERLDTHLNEAAVHIEWVAATDSTLGFPLRIYLAQLRRRADRACRRASVAA